MYTNPYPASTSQAPRKSQGLDCDTWGRVQLKTPIRPGRWCQSVGMATSAPQPSQDGPRALDAWDCFGFFAFHLLVSYHFAYFFL